MNEPAVDQSNSLQQARGQLQTLLSEQEGMEPKSADTGVLSRMLVHIDNIAKSVGASKEDHLNASKRLNDFANTIERMSRVSSPAPEGKVVEDMRALTVSLRTAGSQLADAANPPPWAGGSANV